MFIPSLKEVARVCREFEYSTTLVSVELLDWGREGIILLIR
jgi:hypothetical protein